MRRVTCGPRAPLQLLSTVLNLEVEGALAALLVQLDSKTARETDNSNSCHHQDRYGNGGPGLPKLALCCAAQD